MQPTRVLVVIPTYNEADNIVPLVREILARDRSLEALVVDDASPDGTGQRVAAAARSEPRLSLLARSGKLGLGSAYRAGFRYGLEHGYDWILTMDADGSHAPRHLPALLEAARTCDLAVGSRYVPGGEIRNWPPHRRALSAFANLYTRTLLGLSVRDCTSGYRAYARRVLEAVDPAGIRSSGYSFLEEMLYRAHRAGFRITEVPILFEDRTAGASKISHHEIYLAAWHVLVTAWRARVVASAARGRRRGWRRSLRRMIGCSRGAKQADGPAAEEEQEGSEVPERREPEPQAEVDRIAGVCEAVRAAFGER